MKLRRDIDKILKNHSKITNYLFIITILCISFFLFTYPKNDKNILIRIKTGEMIYKNSRVKIADEFSYGRKKEQPTNFSWLADLIFFIIYNKLGKNFLGLIKPIIGLLTSIYILKILSLFNKEKLLLISIFILIFSFISRYFLNIEPLMFTMLFFSILYYVIINKKYISYLPILFLIWANIDQGFIIGLVLLLIYSCIGSQLDALKQKRKKVKEKRVNKGLIFTIFLACILVSLLNPYYSKVYTTIFTYPLNINRLFNYSPLLLIFVMPIIFYYIQGLWNILAIKLNGPYLLQDLYKRSTFKYVAIALISISFFFLTISTRNFAFDKIIKMETFPKSAVNFISSNNISGNIFNSKELGYAIIWKLYPKYKVAIDSRGYSLYSNEYIKLCSDIEDNKVSFKKFFEKEKVNIVFIKKDKKLSDRLIKSNNWVVAFESPEDRSIIFIKNEENNLKIIPKEFIKKAEFKLISKYLYLGYQSLQKDEIEKAEIFIKKAFDIDPHNLDVQNNLAIISIKKGNLDEAKQRIKFILDVLPDYVPGIINLAYLYERENKIPDAISEYEKILKIQPDNKIAKDALKRLNKLNH